MATKKSENPKERLTARIFNSKWRKLVTVMASVVVFTTVYALILPAITMSAQDAKCGYEEHMHTEECYDAEGNLICEFEEHIHSLACYSDLYADLENPETWEASIPALIGDRNADVVAIAESQLGYRESDKNYLVSDEDQTQGYTRYGHWFGDVVDGSGERLENGLSTFAYADWNAIFASFVLDHAGIYDFGLDSDAGNWAGALAAAGIYEDAADYIPEAGDLVFYTPYSGAGIQVGIVTGVNKGFLGFGDISSISVISGDSDNAVDEVRVAVADYNEGDVVFESIHGYGVLTPREEGTEDVSEAQEVIDESGAETEIPADETTADEAALISEEVPEKEAVADESVTETASGNAVEVVSGDVSVVEQLIPEGTSVAETAEGGVAEDPAEIKEEPTKEEVAAEQPTEGEADEAADGTEETIANLSDDTEHIIGSSSEDLEKVEEIAAGNVQVNALETSGLSEEGSSVIMNWQIAAQLEEDVLPAGAIIRVDTATGKMHAMSVEEAKAWASTVALDGEEVALCDDENYEIIFVGNNDLLYTWADVQTMNEDAVTAFTGVQVKVLTDVEIVDGQVAFGFQTSAKIDDANAGQNYYITKVNVNGLTGSGNYVYENGAAVQADQNRVLQDAGLDYVAPSTLVAEGNDYTVTMTYGEDAQIPDVAKLYVKEIVSGTEEYDNYIAEAKKALGISEAADVVLQGRFFDIKIMTKDGEFEPKAPVQVDIQYDKVVNDVSIDNVNAVHIDGDGAEQIASVAKGRDDELSGINFEAESFSVYGVVYSVDFIYNGYTYYLDGNHEILLSELLPILDIDVAVSDIKNVSVEMVQQNDETAEEKEFYIEKTEDDWLLKSDVAFGNVYTLTIELDEAIYAITVKDVQESTELVRFINNLVITGAVQQDDGSYLVEEGKSYNLIASFSEDSDYQFANRSQLTYQMPTGVAVLSPQTGNMTINVVYKGKTYEVDASYNLGTNGALIIDFDENDPEFHKLEQATNVSFRFNYYAQFDKSSTELDFGNNIIRNLVFEDPKPGEAYASKTATYDEATGIFHYTIKVKATGDVTNVNVKDQILGNVLIFNNDVNVSGNSSGYRDNGSSNGFDYTFDRMNEGEEITITYSATVDYTKDTDKDGIITVDQTKNTVTAKPEGDTQPHSSEYSHEIKYKTTVKSDGSVVETRPNGDQIIEWTIDYNKERLVSAAGDKITDTIAADSTEYMRYEGGHITVEVFDQNGQAVRPSADIPYEDLEYHSDSTWTYRIPSTDTGKYYYRITYKTIVPIEKINQQGTSVKLTNDANGEPGQVDIQPTNKVTIEKSVESQTETQVNWKTVIHVPEGGLTKAVVTDIVPNIWNGHITGENNWIYEDIIGDDQLAQNIHITGLHDGETYTTPQKIIEGNTNNAHKYKIEFFYNGNPGLKGVPGGHDITIRYSTIVNQEWLKENYADPTDDTTREHMNSVDINGTSDTASAQFVKLSFEKKGPKHVENADGSESEQGVSTYTLDGKTYTFLRYELWITGLTQDSISLSDQFDTSLMTLPDPVVINGEHANLYEHMMIYGGDYPGQAGEQPTPVRYSESESGLTIDVDSVPKNADGNNFRNYKIVYYLQLRDDVDLEALAKANGGNYTISNKAKWGDFEPDFDYEVKLKYLDKKLLNEDELGGTNRKAKYQITFNPDKLTVNNSEPITLTDTLSPSLSIDYGSIEIVTDPAGVEVPYSLSGNDDHQTIATYSIPDNTSVTINYEALVVGNGSVTITNVAKTDDRESTTTSTKDYGSASEGQGAVIDFKIVKVDGYDASKKLDEVYFKFYSDGNHPFDEAGTVNELLLHTDEKGEIYIDGDDYKLYFGVKYYLQEVEPKEGYAAISFPYQITLTNNMADVNYGEHGEWVYYYADSMQIKNWPLEGLIVEKQVESNDEADLTKYFTFRVSILNEDGTVNAGYNELNSDCQFENGVYKFTLKDGEQMMFWGFEKGTKYKVEEIDADGYAKSVTYTVYNEEGEAEEVKTEVTSSHTGTLTQDEEVIVFTNSTKGKLRLKKKVDVNESPVTSETDSILKKAIDGTYTFNIYAKENKPTSTEETWKTSPIKTITITFENGEITGYTPTDDQDVESGVDGSVERYIGVNNLPVGDYKIVETKPENGASLIGASGGRAGSGSSSVDDAYVIVTVAKGDDVAATATATFTNNINVGDLQVSKTVTEGSSTSESFTFKVSLTAPQDMNLAESYPVVKSGEDGFTMVSVSDLASTGITLTGGQTFTIRNLPVGTTYTVTEDNHEGWTKIGEVYSNNQKTIAKAVTDTAAFTNRQNGALKLAKKVTVNGDTSTDALTDGTYVFIVQGPGSDGTVRKEVRLTISSGNVTGALVDNEPVIPDAEGYVLVPNLEPGQYTVSEQTPTNGTSLSLINDEVATGSSAEVTVKDGDTAALQASLKFTNNIDTGNLELTKMVTGTDDTVTAFNFTIQLTPPDGVTLSGSYPATITGDDSINSVTVDNGTITQSLKAGQKLTITGLPTGTKYVITEDDYSALGYVQGATANLGTTESPIEIPAKSTVSASVENKFQAEGETDFKVRKTFTNGDLNKHTFTFTLTQVSGDGSTDVVTTKLETPVMVSTEATIGGSQQTLSFPLPSDFKFTQDDIGKTFWFMIEENVEPGIELDSNNIDQTNNIRYAAVRKQWVSATVSRDGSSIKITKSTGTDAPADAEFTNEQLGEIKVKKIVKNGGTEDSTDNTTFYFGLSSTSDNFTRVANTSNVEVKASEGEKIAWTNLPIGKYYVFEMQGGSGDIANQPVGSVFGAYTVTNSGTEAELSAQTTSGSAEIINNKELVDIDATKTWKNADGQDISDKIAKASVTFTLKQSIDDGQTWSDVEGLTADNTTSTATVTRTVDGTASTDKSIWTVKWTNLPKYSSGTAIKYKVLEEVSSLIPADAVPEGDISDVIAEFVSVENSNDKATVGITNKLPKKEISGTKTWVDTHTTHNSPVLTLTRKSSKAGATAEVVKNSAGTENLQPTWEGNNYKYTDLPKYDDEGYEYTYEVAEASFEVNSVTYTAVKAADGTYTVTSSSDTASAYVTTQNGNDFINTELTKFEFMKFWTTGGNATHDAWHEGKNITVTLSRKLIPEGSTDPAADPDPAFSETYVLNKDGVVGSSTYPVTVTANGNDYTFTITGLPANGSMSIGGAETTGIWKYYLSEQAIDGYDVYYFESGASTENHGKESVDNGGTIQNDLKTFDLPHTGGIGTMPIRMVGAVMIVVALLGAFLMRRREGRCDG